MAIQQTNLPGVKLHARGKVRDIYDLKDHYLIVATDRLSAFDVVLPTPIPDKGKVLTQMSAFWFQHFQNDVPNHVVSTRVEDFPTPLHLYRDQLEGRSMLVKKAKVFPVECVARGYLTGSGLKDYNKTGKVCGISLPAGLRDSDRLPEPLFTPSTKAETGHDENISEDQAASIIGADNIRELKRLTLMLYSRGVEYALQRGIIICDTKFESASSMEGSRSWMRCSRPILRGSGPPISTCRESLSRPSTSSSCGIIWNASDGISSPLVRNCQRISSRLPAPSTKMPCASSPAAT
jgi:phosphoribosylaminoimidazole-succinocarboxamide synthase